MKKYKKKMNLPYYVDEAEIDNILIKSLEGHNDKKLF